MDDLFQSLPATARHGSKPRCHLLTQGTRKQVAERLTTLITPWGTVAPTDCWMPDGFTSLDEAELHTATTLLDATTCEALARWWLPAHRRKARTPNWDVAATCSIEGQPGMLLVEAKTHANELIHEGSGRRLDARGGDDPTERRLSHVTIGAAIDAACASLVADTALPWKISRDSHYQLSNRFAWTCKLTELGLPVILVYLGFLHADEMADRGAPFGHVDEWSGLVKSHGSPVVPPSVWDTRWTVHGQAFIPLLKAIDQPLPIQSGA